MSSPRSVVLKPRTMPKRRVDWVDQKGKRYGNLKVLEWFALNCRKEDIWYLRCECGRFVFMRAIQFAYGHSKSCGHCPKIRRTVCDIDGCNNPPKTRRVICSMHAHRLWKYGDVHYDNSRGYRVKIPSYLGMHDRVRTARGKATNFSCVDCGRQAQEWSYNHEDHDELVSNRGYAYSMEVDHYDPRCVSCHRVFDREMKAVNREEARHQGEDTCPRGHPGSMRYRPDLERWECRRCTRKHHGILRKSMP